MKLIFVASIFIALLSALTIVTAQFEFPMVTLGPPEGPPYYLIGKGRRNEKCKPPGCDF